MYFTIGFTCKPSGGNDGATEMEVSRVKSRFPELLQLMLPAGTNEALDELASNQHRTKSEVVRQGCLGRA